MASSSPNCLRKIPTNDMNLKIAEGLPRRLAVVLITRLIVEAQQ